MSKNESLRGEHALSLELVEEAGRDFNSAVNTAIERINKSYPNMLFQEKHTSGYLWWKREWYTYWRYSEGQMIQLSSYSVSVTNAIERGK